MGSILISISVEQHKRPTQWKRPGLNQNGLASQKKKKWKKLKFLFYHCLDILEKKKKKNEVLLISNSSKTLGFICRITPEQRLYIAHYHKEKTRLPIVYCLYILENRERSLFGYQIMNNQHINLEQKIDTTLYISM